ncbi:MAG: hypothetical protein NVS3B10_08160 [Polyangiales bacterium]
MPPAGPRPPADRARSIEAALLSLIAARGGKTICPSEVARAVEPTRWRTRMPEVRAVVATLRARGAIVVTQRGRPVDPAQARGPVRIGPSQPAARPGGRRARVAPPDGASPARNVDFRAHPEAYRVGRGEQGVLTVEPYKSELLPLWRFRTPELARRSAIALWNVFVRYRRASDFVGMDMARKFLQMGFTRARRYANHPSGRKYGADGRVLPRAPRGTVDGKALAAEHFRARWQRVLRDPTYRRWRAVMRAQSRLPGRPLRP